MALFSRVLVLVLCRQQCGGADGAYAEEAMNVMVEDGYHNVAEVRGGFSEWAKLYRPNGERRWTFAPMQHLGDSHSLHM